MTLTQPRQQMVVGVDVNEGDVSENGDIKLDSVRNTILTMGQIDSRGGADEAVIRVAHTTSVPPAFTLVIPSTQEWNPLGSLIPNDAMGNLNIMTGQSRLLDASYKALTASIDAYYLENPDAPRPPAVMVAGFSQGGITAGAFAELYGEDLNVKQVLTVGAEIGRFDIDSDVNVVAYEATGDLVPKLGGARNPAEWETIEADNGGGTITSHKAVLYAGMADDLPPKSSASFDQFFDSNSVIEDYHARK
ncbi:hypothetical protein I6E74_02885 [Salinibacterium sp. SWN139]|uniref:hypothetical protein n=1 Tax=Salinibacterium sp. SWN139 TaxID=2792055 RepID=UPI0018CEF9C1|nr:hypothetical protein [Salinibacterium sp. SWN139]MBH0053114.1 hypothetical protein [Salinibacterium sp. SWN139]